MRKYQCVIMDRCEGRIQVEVRAASEDDAEIEAGIAAAERGCRDVDEIEVLPLPL